jgi:hypothetical protein
MHCKFETLPGLEFLSCGITEKGTKDCNDDACRTVEGAVCKAPDSQKLLAAPPELADASRVFRLIEESSRKFVSFVAPDLIPPELPVSWLFSYRAAQPPRAPSLTA